MLRVTTQLRHTVFSWQSCRHSPPSQWRSRHESAVLCQAAVQDEVHRCMSANNEVSLLTVSATRLVQEACTRHGTAPTASAALGRALLGSLLMGCFREETEKTQVTFNGNGILAGIQVISDAHGNAKGKVGNPLADPPLRPDGKLNVGGAVGKGVLAVVRSNAQAERPFTGMVPIVSGEIGEDLASYMVESEQTNSALGVGVSINRDASIRAAGGFLIQILPFASEETVRQLEANVQGVTSVTELLHHGKGPRDLAEQLLHGLGLADGGFSLQPRYGPCEAADLQHRMKRAVALLGPQEVKTILETEGKIEVTCEFCKETYQFSEEDVMKVNTQL
eukprot:jgi/Astpho2/9132/e_gw1.00134.7.1_t